MPTPSSVAGLDLEAQRQQIYQKGVSGLKWGGLTLAIFAGVMLLFPNIDPWVAGLFYDPTLGGKSGFWLRDDPWLNLSFDLVDWASWVAVLLSFGWAITAFFKKHRTRLVSSVVALSLLVGPLFAVNELFKEHWGRPRPRDTITFGGEHPFSPAFHYVQHCERNCSFPSGHAAAGFAPVVGHFVTRSRRWLVGGLILGSIVGLTRISVGAHFFSDVIFAFLVVFLAAALVATLKGRKRPPGTPN